MNKLLLISANKLKEPYPVYPLGISYLKTYLNKHLVNIEVILFDYNLNTHEDLISIIKSEKPKYIGISLRNIDGADSLNQVSFVPAYKEIIDVVKLHSSVPIIVGGAGFSIYPKKIFELLRPNFGIIGEGEEPLRKLIIALENGDSVKDIEGIVCEEGDSIYCNTKRNAVSSLCLNFENSYIDYYWKNSGMLNIQTKRGCPYECIYCSYPLIEGNLVRTLDADIIVDNISRLKKDKNIDYFFFTDSVFNIKNSFNIELAEKIILSNLNIRWGAYFSPANLTEEQLVLYKKSGLTHIEFGTESLSDAQLENYNKRFTVADVLEKSEICFKHNIYYAHFLILGGYGETEKTILESMENSKRINYSVFFPFIGMRIYPNTKLQKIAIDEKLILADDSLIEPTYYIADGFNLERTRLLAQETEKSWVFPDDKKNELINTLRIQRNKKGPIWEYLRKP